MSVVLDLRGLQVFKAPHYNPPAHFAMFFSQWAHHLYSLGVYTYEEYRLIQDYAYEQPKWKETL